MNNFKRKVAIAAAAALVGLAGCASSGDMNVTGYLDDATITARVKTAIYNEPTLKVMDIGVSTAGNVVHLNGAVKTYAERNRAADVARHVEGVKRVQNNLKVE